MAKKTAKGVGGRKRGMDKRVLDARKHIRTWGELEYKVSADVLEAYNVIRGVMYNQEAPAATRRSAANDIIAFFKEMKENSEVIVKEFEENYEGGQPEEKSEVDNVQPLFKWSE